MTLTLGIETSCDETALAVVDGGRVLAENMATQADAHSVFGGVVPELASREHLRVLGPLLDDVLRRAGCTASDLELVAVARGPGLLGSLLVGMSLAKGLVLATGAALVGVNHLWAHLLVPAVEREIPFPALGLLVSGGHTQTFLISSPVEFETLGRTLDDAAGEAFDKAAKSFNLPYPGGRHIDDLGRGVEPDRTMFPRPYLNNSNLNFSFSGLKTAVAKYVAANPGLKLSALPGSSRRPEDLVSDLDGLRLACASFNWSVAESLRIKTERALDAAGEVKVLIMAGGVAANSVIRETMAALARDRGLDLLMPSPRLCTDNGTMIALAGETVYNLGYCHGLDLEAVPRGRRIPWDYQRIG